LPETLLLLICSEVAAVAAEMTLLEMAIPDLLVELLQEM
jgi:hypothetical protein